MFPCLGSLCEQGAMKKIIAIELLVLVVALIGQYRYFHAPRHALIPERQRAQAFVGNPGVGDTQTDALTQADRK